MSVTSEQIERDFVSEADEVTGDFCDVNTSKSEELTKRGKEKRKLPRRSLRSGKPRRLAGGADEPDPEDRTESVQQQQDGEDESGNPSTLGSASAESRNGATESKHQPLAPTGDPRVDEMLECALHNLEEAGKALASLGENLEHELKLFLVELMNRTRKWTSGVESKLEWTRRDCVVALHKELASRMSALSASRRESLALKEKLAQTEAAKDIAQRSLTETLKTGQRMDPSMGDLSKVPSQTRSMKLGACNKSPSRCESRLMPDNDDIHEIRAENERLQMCCAEMECEITELRKENERIVKERAEYENAIQRALLKGVSSLNVEALKVLKCTPIPQCCPPPSSSIEPVQQQQQSSRGRDCGGNPMGQQPQQQGGCGGGGGGNGRSQTANSSCKPCPGRLDHQSGMNSYNNGNGQCGGSSRDQLGGNGGRRGCSSPGGHSERKSKKSKDNMLLLLHQRDAENFGIQTGCDSAPRKSTACSGGGNYGKYGKSNNNC